MVMNEHDEMSFYLVYRYNALWLGITTEISGGKRKLTSKVVEMKILFRLPYNRIIETSHELFYI